MEILTYDQVDPQQVLSLNLLGLGYALTPERVNQMKALEVRLAPVVGFYAVEDGQVLGQVGVMRTVLETLDGPEDFGALWAVTTRPDQTRKGIASALIHRAHDYLRQMGLVYSFLTTSRSLVAHALYRKAGYEDLVELAQAFAPPVGDAQPLDDADEITVGTCRGGEDCEALLYSVYLAANSCALGFTRRSPQFVAAAEAAGDLTSEAVHVLRRGETAVGYALVRPGAEVAVVDELKLSPGVGIRLALLALRRALTPRPVVYRAVLPPGHEAPVLAAGFQSIARGPGVIMTVSLDGPADAATLRARLDLDSGRFTYGAMDAT